MRRRLLRVGVLAHTSVVYVAARKAVGEDDSSPWLPPRDTLRQRATLVDPMKFSRRTFLHLSAGAAALPAFPRPVGAQTYPTRPLSIIVQFAAGRGTDLSAVIAR